MPGLGLLIYLVHVGLRDPSQPGVEGKVFLRRQELVQGVKLRAVTNAASHAPHIPQDAVAVDVGRARSHLCVTGQHLEGGGLARTVHPKETEALVISDKQDKKFTVSLTSHYERQI